jgi:hypothetical protein
METITNVTIYKCEHCNKKLFRKHAMINHEIKCKENPLNIRSCFDCSLCEMVKIKFELSTKTYEGEELGDSNSFKCKAKNIFMYPPKLKHSNNGIPEYVEHEGKEITQEEMPIECSKKISYGDEFNEMFNY